MTTPVEKGMAMKHESFRFSVVPDTAAWFCWPWRLRFMEREPVTGGVCIYCNREIALPKHSWNRRCGCLYCGLDRNELPRTEAESYAADIPFNCDRSSLTGGRE